MNQAFSNPFEVIDARLSLIEQLLIEIKHRPPCESIGTTEQKQVLSLAEFCQYTGIGKQTAYRLTSRGEVPHSKRGKRLYFDKAQVDAWLLANHVGGSAEADRKANEYVMTKRRAKRA